MSRHAIVIVASTQQQEVVECRSRSRKHARKGEHYLS